MSSVQASGHDMASGQTAGPVVPPVPRPRHGSEAGRTALSWLDPIRIGLMSARATGAGERREAREEGTARATAGAGDARAAPGAALRGRPPSSVEAVRGGGSGEWGTGPGGGEGRRGLGGRMAAKVPLRDGGAAPGRAVAPRQPSAGLGRVCAGRRRRSEQGSGGHLCVRAPPQWREGFGAPRTATRTRNPIRARPPAIRRSSGWADGAGMMRRGGGRDGRT